MSTPQPFAAWVGIDWADEQHAVCLLAEGSPRAEHRQVAQQAEALDAWAAELHQRFDGRPLAVCLEQSRGALIYALMKYEFLVLFPLNPKQLAKYRQAFSPSGAKDDPQDAELLCRFVREHHGQLRAWRADDACTRQLRLLCEDRRRWVAQRTALGNQLLQRLKETFPWALKFQGREVHGQAFLRWLAKFPTHSELRRASPKQLERYLPKRRRVPDDPDTFAPWVAEIRAALPLVTDEAVLAAARLAIVSLVRGLEQLNAIIAQYDQQIAQVMAQHPDAALFHSLPGAGAALAPRLAAALGTDRGRFRSAADLQQFSGIAPITVRSGKSCQVRRRRACPHFLRQTFHEFARCSLMASPWAAAYCRMLRAKGHAFHAAVRSLAYKWLRIIFRCWQDRKPYDEQRYLNQLQQKSSPLLAYLPPNPSLTEP